MESSCKPPQVVPPSLAARRGRRVTSSSDAVIVPRVLIFRREGLGLRIDSMVVMVNARCMSYDRASGRLELSGYDGQAVTE